MIGSLSFNSDGSVLEVTALSRPTLLFLGSHIPVLPSVASYQVHLLRKEVLHDGGLKRQLDFVHLRRALAHEMSHR